MAVPPAPVRVPSQRPLAPSVASVTSVANNKDDNEIILGAVHRTPGICFTAEENPRKPQLGDNLMKRLCDLVSIRGYVMVYTYIPRGNKRELVRFGIDCDRKGYSFGIVGRVIFPGWLSSPKLQLQINRFLEKI